ncbi:hypothetical protein ACIBCT_38795 [Streptosporangium sp. NPDC050855]|uniref:hypothetical protein n=1 Tax=Streptosporangium sp. NPDC050855 TaxID=3366194 RepID=UPI00379909A3
MPARNRIALIAYGAGTMGLVALLVKVAAGDPGLKDSSFSLATLITSAAVGTTYMGQLLIASFEDEAISNPISAITSQRLLSMAAFISGRSRGWRLLEWAADLERSPKPVRYASGLVWAALRMRLADLTGPLWRAACWMLTTEARTWGPLGIVIALAVVNIYHSQGWGTAFFTGLVEITAVAQGVQWLRKRWGVTVKGSKKQPEEG